MSLWGKLTGRNAETPAHAGEGVDPLFPNAPARRSPSTEKASAYRRLAEYPAALMGSLQRAHDKVHAATNERGLGGTHYGETINRGVELMAAIKRAMADLRPTLEERAPISENFLGSYHTALELIDPFYQAHGQASHHQGGLGRSASPYSASTAREGKDWVVAEEIAAKFLRQVGYRDARTTAPGSDRGLDVLGTGVAAQVKYMSRPCGRPLLQQLVGAAGGRHAIFFSHAGYSQQAIEYADFVGMALFEIILPATVRPINGAARTMTDRRTDTYTSPEVPTGGAAAAGDEETTSSDSIEADPEVREAQRLSQQYFDLSTDEFFKVVRRIMDQRGKSALPVLEPELSRVERVIKRAGTGTLPLSEFTAVVDEINQARERLVSIFG